jgi:hypothetical protein
LYSDWTRERHGGYTPLPVEESPSGEDASVYHPLVLYVGMVSKELQLLGKSKPMHQIRLANLVHAVVAIDEVQERGGLHGNQVYPVALKLPQALCLG